MNLKRKKTMMIIGIVLCSFVIIICVVLALNKIIQDQKSIEEYQAIEQEVILPDISNPDVSNKDISEPDIPVRVDFARLKQMNKDIVGWLYIPCLQISYPIMHSEDNDYYLHRNINGEYRFAGSIFLDMANTSDFSDPNSILYGHNMLNGTMFGKLWHIVYHDAAKDDPYFWILTPEKAYRYQIFTAYETKTDASTYRLYRYPNEEFKNWCYEMQSLSFVDFANPKLTPQSHVVTLSTCVGTSKTARTIVQGVQDSVFDYTKYQTNS